MRLVVAIFSISIIQSSLFAPICFFYNNIFPKYEQQILIMSNHYWTISTCMCYLIIIIAITYFSARSAINLKQSIKTAEKLRKGPEKMQLIASPSKPTRAHEQDGQKGKEDIQDYQGENNLTEHIAQRSSAIDPVSVASAKPMPSTRGSFGSKLTLGYQKSECGDSVSSCPMGADRCSSADVIHASKRAKSKTMQRDLRLTKALLAVASAYIICCTPYTLYLAVFRLMPYELLDKISPTTQMGTKLIVHTLYLFNYVINPFTYLVFNEFFRGQISKLPILRRFRHKLIRQEEANVENNNANEPEERPDDIPRNNEEHRKVALATRSLPSTDQRGETFSTETNAHQVAWTFWWLFTKTKMLLMYKSYQVA